MAIFLSASIPYGKRAKEFVPDPVAIREAVRSLVMVMSPTQDIVFGGHPAINPFVLDAARSLGTMDRIHIFQSEYFKEHIPCEVFYFKKILWTPQKEGQEESLLRMRNEMMNPEHYHIPPYLAAFFIGGMNGVIDEWKLFRDKYPEKPCFPLASTEGAARKLVENGLIGSREWDDETRYHHLFSEILKKITVS